MGEQLAGSNRKPAEHKLSNMGVKSLRNMIKLVLFARVSREPRLWALKSHVRPPEAVTDTLPKPQSPMSPLGLAGRGTIILKRSIFVVN